MVDYLLELGIDEEDVKNIMEFNKPYTDYDDYKKNIETLKIIECDDKEINNIIISNPNILIRSNEDIIKLIKKLRFYGFSNINILFDTNPFLLNKDDYEIEEYFNDKIKQGLSVSEIIDIIESEPYAMD